MEYLIVTTADGRELKFSHLSLYDIFGNPQNPDARGYVYTFHKSQRLELRDTLRESGMDTDGIAQTMVEFNKKYPLDTDRFTAMLSDPIWRAFVIEDRWRKANADAAYPDNLTVDDAVAIREGLFNPLNISFKEKQDIAPPAFTDTSTFGDGGATPNPQVPPTFQDAGGKSETTSASVV